MQNLERRPSGIYVARLTIPSRLRGLLGATRFISSTGTSNREVAKVLAAELVARWRRHLFELDRLATMGSSISSENILRIADGHPLLLTGGHLPIVQAATAVGLAVEDLLRSAADGRLALFCRMQGEPGYIAPGWAFEPDDPEMGTVVIPSRQNRPTEARLHRAFGILQISKAEAAAVANALLVKESAAVVTFEAPDLAKSEVFVPDSVFYVQEDDLEVSAVELDSLRRKMADAISPAAIQAAREAVQRGTGEISKASRSGLRLSEAAAEYCATVLPPIDQLS